MENTYIFIALLLGTVLGTAIGWLWRSTRSTTGNNEDIARLAILEDRAKRVEQLETKLEATQTTEQDAEKRAIQLTAELNSLRVRIEQREETEEEQEAAEKADAAKKRQDQEHMVAQFKAAAHEIVEQRSKAFDETSKKSIGDLVKPLKEQLEGFKKQLTETEKSASQERISLKEQVKNLKEMNTKISDDAQNLTRALKGDSKARGNWGEMVLARVLELSGLEKGREFETQVTGTTSEGRRVQPDVIVQLPDSRQVVVDAKVSLVAYDAYCAADDTDAQKAAMKDHVNSIRNHAKGLSSKNYQGIEGITTIDYVLMFMPIEAAFTDAMREDRNIFDEAISNKVLIVTPSTLLAVLRTIESIWKHERQSKNSVEIARQAGGLHDKFVDFTESLTDIGFRLGQAQGSYEKAFNQLSTGNGNLVRRAKKLETLGAKTKKKFATALEDVDALEGELSHSGPVLDLVADDLSDNS
jgi:DNA recombination protein RmuC